MGSRVQIPPSRFATGAKREAARVQVPCSTELVPHRLAKALKAAIKPAFGDFDVSDNSRQHRQAHA
jgi:hypothetical protein